MTVQNSTHATQGGRIKSQGLKASLSAAPLVSATVVGIIALGWSHRRDGLVVPDHGLGYALGIIGALLMLSLLLYPVRKRVKAMRTWGRVSDWFRWHMALGVLGPAFIVLHSNFQIQSPNAAVAFFSMLLVAGSGVVGRYLYGRVHAGLYGRKREAQEFLAECAADRGALGLDVSPGGPAGVALAQFEAAVLAPIPSLAAAVGRSVQLGGLIRENRRILTEQMQQTAGRDAGKVREARRRLARYYSAVRRAATFSLYERLFALWHVLHIPLFVILVCTAIIHVVAVNLY